MHKSFLSVKLFIEEGLTTFLIDTVGSSRGVTLANEGSDWGYTR